MSTIKSSDEHLTLNADGSSKDIKFQANGVEKASISSSGAFTSTTIDATALTGTIPNFTSTGIDDNADATAITIDSSENVGIGTSSPAKPLHITGASGDIVSDIGNGTLLQIDGGSISTTNHGVGLAFVRTGSQLGFIKAARENTSNEAGFLSFASQTSGGTHPERMRIDSSGKVLIGDTNDRTTSSTLYAYGNTSSATGTNALELACAAAATRYLAAFINSNGHVGSITTNGSATAFNTSSDYRLKENVNYTWDATTRLKQLKPARFNFIADDTNTLVDGFIAHEVSSVVPEAISGTKDAMAGETFYTEDDVETQGESPTKEIGDVKTYSSTKIDPQGIDQSKLVPLLVKTIQELEARITALEA